jgi:hypothetical protein
MNMKQTQSLEINKRTVICKQAGCGCVGSFPHIFCHPAARPIGGLYEITGVKFMAFGGPLSGQGLCA